MRLSALADEYELAADEGAAQFRSLFENSTLEINQPLASIVMNGNAGLRWLARSKPKLEEARSAFGCIVNDGHRAAQIITGIRAMFRKESSERSPVAINELICEVVTCSARETRRLFSSPSEVGLRGRLFDDLSSTTSASTCQSRHECNRHDGFDCRSSSNACCAFRAAR
jgi:signal transduction histidine kinase